MNLSGTTRYSIRHKQESRKVTAVKLADVQADTDSVDNNKEQDASVDNICYMKLASKLRYLFMTTTIYPQFSEQLYSTFNFQHSFY